MLIRPFMAPDDGAQGAAQPEAQEAQTFTQEEVDKIIGDRLAKERKKLDKEWNDKLTAAKTEAERLATMTAEEKAQHERQQQEEAQKQRESDLEKREAAIQLRELRAEAYETLASKGLPKALAECLSYASADACKASIEAVEKAYRQAVQEGVEERLKSKTPTQNTNSGGGEKSRAAQLAEQYQQTLYGPVKKGE